MKAAGNHIIMLDANQTARWKREAESMRAIGCKEVAEKGIDDPKLAAEAEALIGKCAKPK